MQYATTFFDVRAVESDHERLLNVELVDCIDDALGDDVHSGESAEDVDEDRFHVGVVDDDPQRLDDAILAIHSADVEEVRRFAAVQFERVHRGHGETSALTTQPMLPSSLM